MIIEKWGGRGIIINAVHSYKREHKSSAWIKSGINHCGKTEIKITGDWQQYNFKNTLSYFAGKKDKMRKRLKFCLKWMRVLTLRFKEPISLRYIYDSLSLFSSV